MAIVPAQSPTPDNAAGGQVTTLLGRGSEFEGKLSFEGTVRVDGKLAGEIFSDDVLIVGEGAEVRAEINVGAIVIEGMVHGNINAKRSVEIHTPGRVRGNIVTPSLYIEKGVMFDGNCQMEPNAGPPRATSAPALAVAKLRDREREERGQERGQERGKDP